MTNEQVALQAARVEGWADGFKEGYKAGVMWAIDEVKKEGKPNEPIKPTVA